MSEYPLKALNMIEYVGIYLKNSVVYVRIFWMYLMQSLREKCSDKNTDSVRMPENTDQKLLRIWTTIYSAVTETDGAFCKKNNVSVQVCNYKFIREEGAVAWGVVELGSSVNISSKM